MDFVAIFLSVVLWSCVSGTFLEHYIVEHDGKIVTSEIANLSAETLQDCARKCLEVAPIDTCSFAGFQMGSNLCQLGSQNSSLIEDSPDVNDIVIVLYKMCGAVPVINHGSADVSEDRITATYSCDQPYVLTGNAVLSCIDSSWVGTLPSCVDVDDCLSLPCWNGGTCIDNVGSYTCSCVKGYTGINCETEINECDSLPCMNGGTCSDGLNMYTCSCLSTYTGTNCETSTETVAVLGTGLSDCKAYLDASNTADGIYSVTIWSSSISINVYCDMTTDGGGWTIFQRRYDGSEDFNRTLADYESGFGSLNAEFWLGLVYVQEMVLQGPTELRLDVTANDSSTLYRVYQDFSLGTDNLYNITFGAATGPMNITASRSLEYHLGRCFGTWDRDCEGTGCPSRAKNGWWFNSCFEVNLNGLYMTPGIAATVPGESIFGGMTHYGFLNSYEALKKSQMMFRRI